ncbi:MAG TPA: hypothetical protein VKV37_15650, partial [Ktedonobacteraceae bacterium]|nr:hypothetical protein [Ktedonobacteraceae bacterium]
CYHLAKGQHEDIAIAFDAITGYLPTLQTMVKESSIHRKEAAQLAAQCLLLKARLALHREGPQRAGNYAQQALTYAEESGELALQLVIFHDLEWLSVCSKQGKQALNAALRTQHLLDHATEPIPSLIKSKALAAIAEGQAYNHYQQDALAASAQMYDAFASASDDERFVYVEHDGPTFYDAKTYYYLGQYSDAYNVFEKILDPQTQALKVPVASERSRISVINHMVLAALKRPNKDKELIVPLWMAGMQGAKNLRSEHRYEEALAAYGIMEALWSDDAQIRDLRDLVGRW